jgi:hypothetical protein
LDYYTSGGTAGCPALLVEPSAQNLVLHSRDLTNAVWSGTTVTTAKNAVGADGTASGATRITATAASGTVLQALSHASQSRVFSAYIRSVTGTGAIQLTTNGGTNWTTVTISSTYKQVACDAQTVASGTIGIRMAVSGDVIEVDFTQGEVGPVATSPIPTTAAPVSRNGDVISVSGAVSGCIGQTEGTIYAEVDSRNQQTGRIVSFQIAGTAGSGQIRIDTVGASLRCRLINASGTSLYDQTISPPMSVGINKMAFAFNSAASGIVVALNGSIVNTGTAAASTVHNAAQLTIGAQDSVAGFGSFYNDRIRAVALYTTRLTNAELIALSTL